MMNRRALIVGAGVGGLAAGIALRRAGWSVSIFECAAEARELGFALNLAPNAVSALRELGIADVVVAAGAAPGLVEIRAPGNRVLRRMHIAQGLRGTAAIVALRPVLHGALLQSLPDETIHLNREAVAFSISGNAVVLRFGDASAVEGDLLVGADGVGSAIRKQLHPREGAPRRTGYWAMRGVAYNAERYLGELSAIAYLGNGVECAMARAGSGSVYWYLSLLAEDVAAANSDSRRIIERVAADLDADFRNVSSATAADDLRLNELFDRDPIPVWGSGHVTLLGDAAHPMLPHAGQGAAQALEDAVALGLSLSGGGGVAESLRRFEAVRAPRTAAFVRLSRRIVRSTTTKNRVVCALRNAAMKVVPERAIVSGFFRANEKDPHRELRYPRV